MAGIKVNKLSYKIYRFLKIREWVFANSNERFIIIKPPPNFRYKNSVSLPIDSHSVDFYTYMKNVLELMNKLYPDSIDTLNKIVLLNENLKNRYKKEWILPEIHSIINKIEIDEVYLPKKLKL